MIKNKGHLDMYLLKLAYTYINPKIVNTMKRYDKKKSCIVDKCAKLQILDWPGSAGWTGRIEPGFKHGLKHKLSDFNMKNKKIK